MTSVRAAQWLVAQGFRDLMVMKGGLGGWLNRGYPVAAVSQESVEWAPSTPGASAAEQSGVTTVSPSSGTTLLETFLPRLAGGGALAPLELPAKENLVVLFVDMVGSTSLLRDHSAEEVQGLMQVFMEEVCEVVVPYCGDVKDFEGDGALLYFYWVGDAVQAAFALRDALLDKRRLRPALPTPRLSLAMGPMVISAVGSRFRQGIALVGPAVNIAARILKHAPPGGIIVTRALVEELTQWIPDLAGQFTPCDQGLQLKGLEEEEIAVCLALPPAERTEAYEGLKGPLRPQ